MVCPRFVPICADLWLKLAEVLINPLKYQGVADVTDAGIVMPGKVSTVPIEQFIIRKEVWTEV